MGSQPGRRQRCISVREDIYDGAISQWSQVSEHIRSDSKLVRRRRDGMALHELRAPLKQNLFAAPRTESGVGLMHLSSFAIADTRMNYARQAKQERGNKRKLRCAPARGRAQTDADVVHLPSAR